MKRIFLDTNVLLDLIDEKRSGHEEALRLESLIEKKSLRGLLSWHSLSLIEYVGRREFGREGILEVIRGFLDVFQVPRTGSDEAKIALGFITSDFEDAMQIASAVAGKADYLVTNDGTGFEKSPVPVVSPLELSEL